jgi:two-component system nitrogen regulation response regulator GlnG
MLNLIKKAVKALKTREGRDVSGVNILKEYENFKIIGTSAPMQEIYKTIGKISDSNVTVLLSGASGTGKELIAKAIHLNSSRANKPFVAVNCTAIPETLIESEFFGHVKGAFTGAFKNKTGKFEQANQGTIFLDEIGDINLSTQAKLLRVLQERQILPVGGNDSIDIDIRVISATNKPLKLLMDEKNFRLDLLHRLKVVTIEVPGLETRKEDIPELIRYFIGKSEFSNKDSIMISDNFIQECQKRSWPGNVRELENAVISSLALCRDNLLLPEHLPRLIEKENLKNLITSEDMPDYSNNEKKSCAFEKTFENALLQRLSTLIDNSDFHGKIYDEIIQNTEKCIIRNILEKYDGNQVKTAALLGINRHTLKNKIHKYNIK